MRPFLRLAPLLLWLTLLFQACPLQGIEAPNAVPAELRAIPALADALALASEGSWALARSACERALPTLTKPNEIGWARLLLAECTQRAEPRPADWQAAMAWNLRHDQAYLDLLKPYADSTAKRDALWLALTEARILFHTTQVVIQLPDLDVLALRSEVLDTLAAEPPTPASAQRWFEALRTHAEGLCSTRYPLNSMFSDRGKNAAAVLTRHLEAAASCELLDREARTWARLRHKVLLSGLSPKKPAFNAEAWAKDLDFAKGTSLEPLAAALRFIDWAARPPSSKDARSDNTDPRTGREAPDFQALLKTLRGLLAALPPDKGDPLNSYARQSLEFLDQNWSNPVLNTYLTDSPLPGEALSLDYGQSGYASLEWKLYKLAPEDWAKLRQNSPGSAGAFEALLGKPPLLAEGSASLPKAESLAWKQERLLLQQSLKPGLYVVTVAANGPKAPSFTKYFFTCSPLKAQLLRCSNGEASVWLEDAQTGKPLQAAEVDLLLQVQRDTTLTQRKISRLRTDNAGCVRVPKGEINQLMQGATGSLTAIAIHGDSAAAINFWTEKSISDEGRLVGDLFVERPLYRPGETVNWRLFLRERKDGNWAMPAKPYRMIVVLKNEKTVLLDQQHLTADEAGALTGSYTIPDKAKPGTLVLGLLPDGDSPLDIDSLHKNDLLNSPLCRIDNFLPPPVQASLEIVGGAATLRQGAHGVFRAKATYFSGGPVPGAKVKLSMRCHRINSSRLINPTSPTELWRTTLNKEAPRNGSTDAEGKADFTLDIPATLEGLYELSATLEIQVEGIPPFRSYKSWTLSPSGLTCENLSPEERLCPPGGRISFRTRLVDGEGSPAPGVHVVASLCEKRWVEAWLSPDGKLTNKRPKGFPLPEPDADWRRRWQGWELLQSGNYESPVSEQQLQSDAEGRLALTLPLPREGIYSLQLTTEGEHILPKESPNDFERTNPFDSLGDAVAEFVAATPLTKTLAFAPRKGRLAAAAPDPNNPGTRLVLAVAADPESSAFLACLGEGKSHLQRLEPGPALHLIPVPLVEGPQAHHRLELIASNASRTLKLAPRASPDALQVSLQAPQGPITPGSELTLSAQAGTLSGKPMPALLAVAVTDDALNALLPDIASDEEPAFLAPRPSLTLHRSGSKDPRYGTLSLVEFMRDQRLRPESEDDRVVLSPFEVSADFAPGYCASESISGTRLQTTLQDLGSAINVVSPDLFQKVDSTNLDKVLSPSSGTHPAGPAAPLLRRHFASSAFWAPLLKTDAKGQAQISFKLPDNLTRWKARVYAVTPASQGFAKGSVSFEATLPLQARLQKPRFLVAGDTLQLRTTLLNREPSPADATLSLSLSGPLRLLENVSTQKALLPASGQKALLWNLQAEAAGNTHLKLEARTARHADASEEMLPVLEDGSHLPLAASAVLPSGSPQATLSLTLPSPLDPARTQLSFELSPSLAGTLLEALPYLIDYPYGCVEQTMSRFLPAAVVSKVLSEQNLDAPTLEKAILSRSKLGRNQAAGMDSLQSVLSDSLKRLRTAQRKDGSFGWWPGDPSPDPWMSAYVKWGLVTARAHKVALPEDIEDEVSEMEDSLNEALIKWLSSTEAKTPDLQAWTLAALALDSSLVKTEAKPLQEVFERLYQERATLKDRGRACLALAAASLGSASQRATLLRNLENGCVRSTHEGIGELAQWGLGSGYWACDEGAVETTAFTLLALLQLDPAHPLLAPAAHWLALNRRGSQWANTRETSFALLALSGFVAQRGEGRPDAEVALFLNGEALGRQVFDANSLLAGPVSIPVIPKLLLPGKNTLELRRLAGKTPVFATALASVWSPAASALPAGNLITLQRQLLFQPVKPGLLGPAQGPAQAVTASVPVPAGDRLHAEITLGIPQDCDYLMVRIPKAAGCEPLNPLSGWDATLRPHTDAPAKETTATRSAKDISPLQHLVPAEDHGRLLYREEHDDCSIVFINSLPAGTWTLRLPLTAVHAGDFRLLPATVEAMYVGEIRANTDATRVKIKN